MATQLAFEIQAYGTHKHLLNSEYIKGGYAVYATEAERDNQPVYPNVDNDGVIVEGSFCFVQATDKFYYYTGSAWTEFLASGSTNYYRFDFLDDDDGPTLTLVGDNIDIALRSLVPVNYAGYNLGSGVIFKRQFLAGTPNYYQYFVLFPDAVKIYDQQWINGAIFVSDSSETPTNLTFVGWSAPASLTQIQEALPVIEWEDDTTVEISGLSISNLS